MFQFSYSHDQPCRLMNALGLVRRMHMTEDHQFRVAARCELLPYLISLPLGLSRKQAKDLLRSRAVTVARELTSSLITVILDRPLPRASRLTNILAGQVYHLPTKCRGSAKYGSQYHRVGVRLKLHL